MHNPPKYRTLQKRSPENSISGDEHIGGVEVFAISRWFLLLAENMRGFQKGMGKTKDPADRQWTDPFCVFNSIFL